MLRAKLADAERGAGQAATERKRREETALREVEAEHLRAGSTKERIAGGKVIRECAAEARDACAVVKAALGVQLNGPVGLEV